MTNRAVTKLTTHDTNQYLGLVERVVPLFSLDSAQSILMIISTFVSGVTHLIALPQFQSDGSKFPNNLPGVPNFDGFTG
jgi:hypothetical protein